MTGSRVLGRPAHRAQRVDRFGQGELLADEPGDEAPAADLAARLHAAVDLQQHAPRRRAHLARQQLAQHDAVAAQQLAREKLVTADRAVRRLWRH